MNKFKEQFDFPVVESDFDKESGLCYVTIATSDRRFTGVARLHPYDLENHNYTSLSGYPIAHARALIKYTKHFLQKERYLLHTLIQIQSHMKMNSDALEIINKEIADSKRAIDDANQAIKDLNSSVESMITNLDKYYSKGQK